LFRRNELLGGGTLIAVLSYSCHATADELGRTSRSSLRRSRTDPI